METTSNDLFQHLFSTTTRFVWLCIVIITVIFGFKKKLVVFRDYNDLALVFLLSIGPIAIAFILSYLGAPKNLGTYGLLGLVIILFSWIGFRTLQDNHNPIYFLLALITKISLSFLFIVSLISFVAPSGKATSQRMDARRIAFVLLMMVTPLIVALVRDHEGIVNIEKIAARRGIAS